jgi:hypothetical protein
MHHGASLHAEATVVAPAIRPIKPSATTLRTFYTANQMVAHHAPARKNYGSVICEFIQLRRTLTSQFAVDPAT